MTFQLPDLPYGFDALEPHIDTATMQIHHGKHHQTYVNNLNAAIEKAPLATPSTNTLARSGQPCSASALPTPAKPA